MPPRIIPERIREAREGAGFTDEKFAEAIGVTRQAIATYETGIASPSGDAFSRILAVTRQPPSFFTADRRKGIERFQMPNWRSLKRMQRPERLRISRRLEWAYLITEFLAEYVELPPVNLPSICFDFEGDSDERLEKIANSLREFWKIGFGPIADLAPILEYNGFILVEEEVACEDMDAVSRWQGGRPFILYSREVESTPRKLFNLAHELGHLVLHTSVVLNSRNLDKMEYQANRFAGAFLMPRGAFSNEIVNTSLDYLLSLKGRWRVSVSAMVYRLKELGILNAYQVKYIWRQMNFRGMKKKEPLDTAFRLSSPSVLSCAIRLLIENGVKQPTQMAEELAINPEFIESLCSLPSGFLQKKVIALRLVEK